MVIKKNWPFCETKLQWRLAVRFCEQLSREATWECVIFSGKHVRWHFQVKYHRVVELRWVNCIRGKRGITFEETEKDIDLTSSPLHVALSSPHTDWPLTGRRHLQYNGKVINALRRKFSWETVHASKNTVGDYSLQVDTSSETEVRLEGNFHEALLFFAQTLHAHSQVRDVQGARKSCFVYADWLSFGMYLEDCHFLLYTCVCSVSYKWYGIYLCCLPFNRCRVDRSWSIQRTRTTRQTSTSEMMRTSNRMICIATTCAPYGFVAPDEDASLAQMLICSPLTFCTSCC